MTKTVKRILAVVLLLLTVLLVGCLVFTGNRLADYPKEFKDYKSVVFGSKDGTMIAFTENGALYDMAENAVVMLGFTDYSEGVITMEKQGTVYTFVAVGKDMLYDTHTNQILTRRGAYG